MRYKILSLIISITFIFSNNLYSKENINFFPSISEFKNLKGDFGKCLGKINIVENGVKNEYMYYDSRLDIIDANNPDKLRTFENCLLNKSQSILIQKINELNADTKQLNEIFNQLQNTLKNFDLTRSLISDTKTFFEGNRTKNLLLKMEKTLTNVTENYFLKEYGRNSNEYKFVFPVVKEIISLAFKISKETKIGKKLIDGEINAVNIKSFQSKFKIKLGKIITYSEGLLKAALLSSTLAAIFIQKEINFKMSVASFKHRFITEYIFVFRCDINKMANEYKQTSFHGLWYHLWNKSYCTTWLKLLDINNISKEYFSGLSNAARETLSLIENYGNGGIFNLSGIQKIENINNLNFIKNYNPKHLINELYIAPKQYKDVNTLCGGLGNIHCISQAKRIDYSIKPRVIITFNKYKNYADQKIYFSDNKKGIIDIIIIDFSIDIIYTFDDSTHETQQKNFRLCLPSYLHDMKGKEWYAKYLASLFNRGFIKTDQNDMFAPDKYVTVGEFLELFVRNIYSDDLISTIQNDSKTPFFKFADFIVNDIIDRNKIAAITYQENEIYQALFNIDKNSIDTYYLQSNLTRSKIAQFIHYFFYFYEIQTYFSYSEKYNCGELDNYGWDECSTTLKKLKIIEGYSKNYKPQKNITRASLVKILYKIYYLVNKTKISPKKMETINNQEVFSVGAYLVPDPNPFPTDENISIDLINNN